MADTRVTTTLGVKVDAREVGGLGAKLKSTFGEGEAGARRMGGATGQARKEISELEKRVGGLEASLTKIGRLDVFGKQSEAAKKLNAELTRTEQTLRRLESLQARSGGRGGGGGFGGFGGGGGGFGGRGGGGTGQIPMPGMHPLAQMMSAIPVAGVAAAGAFMASMQTYQSYVSHQQAVMEASPYLARTWTTGGGGGGRGYNIDRGEQGGAEALLGALGGGAMSQTWGRGTALAGAAGGLMSGEGMGAGAQSGIALTGQIGNEIGSAIGRTLDNSDTVNAVAGGLYDAAAAAVKGAGGGVSGPRYAPDLSFTGLGTQLGFKPQEAISIAGQYGFGAGRLAGPEDAGFAMAAQRAFGLDTGLTAGASRAMRRAGAGGEPRDVALLIGSAVTKGLVGSEMNEAIQAQAAFLEEQAKYGVKMDVDAMTRMEDRLFMSGIAPELAGPTLQGMVRGVQSRALGGGGTTPLDFIMGKQMGFTGLGGGNEFAEMQFNLQDPNAVMKMLPGLIDRLGGLSPGGPESAQSQYLVQQAIREATGVTLGREQVTGLMTRLSGTEGMDIDRDAILAETIDQARMNTPGVIAAQAGLEAERIGVGAKVADNMLDLERTTLNLAKAFQTSFGPVIDIATGQLEGLSSGVERAAANFDALNLALESFGLGGLR